MKEEAAAAEKYLKGVDHLILLDEHGPQMGSIQLSKHLQGLMNRGLKQTAFLVGGAYGFDPSLRQRAHATWSLSKLTFPHELIRVCAAEQLRAHHLKANLPPSLNNATQGPRCLLSDVPFAYSARTVALFKTSMPP